MSSAPDGDVVTEPERLDLWQRVGTILNRFILWGAGTAVFGFLLLSFLMMVTRSREVAHRSSCRSNLREIGLALRNYHDEWKTFPPAYTVDRNGYRLHSWRTLLLPYLSQRPLYNRIDLSRAWDDPVNAAICRTPLKVYQCSAGSFEPGGTGYLAIVGPQNFLSGPQPRTLKDITDRTTDTLAVIEVDAKHTVPWASPLDADENLVLGLGDASPLPHTGGVYALFADGRVSFVSTLTTADQRKAMMTIAGHEPVTQ